MTSVGVLKHLIHSTGAGPPNSVWYPKYAKAATASEELRRAISRLKTNKRPELDGYTAEWYWYLETFNPPTAEDIYLGATERGDTPSSGKRQL